MTFQRHIQDELSSDEPGNSDRNVDSDCDAAGLRSDGGSGERDPLDRRETLVCDRLQGVMRAMETLVESRLEGRSTEKLVSSASRVFRVITKVISSVVFRLFRLFCTEAKCICMTFFFETLEIAVPLKSTSPGCEESEHRDEVLYPNLAL